MAGAAITKENSLIGTHQPYIKKPIGIFNLVGFSRITVSFMIVSMKLSAMTRLLAIAIVALWNMEASSAWLAPGGDRMPWSLARRQMAMSSRLFSSLSEPSMRRRAAIEGVSLAPQGFWAMLRVGADSYLPWQVTDDPQDAHAATSAEALTLIQLLSGVDMAGAILPPDVLARLVVLHCETVMKSRLEDEDDRAIAEDILGFVQESLPNATVAYSEAHSWVQSRVKLPTVYLDEVLVNANEYTFSLTCSVRDFGTLTFTPTNEMLQSVLYQFSDSTSLAFSSLALALRYKAPMSLVELHENDGISLATLEKKFPMYATVSTLQKSSNRVQENIVRGFEINKLQGALRIAMERGDHQAALRIREALDEYDSMDQLPTADFEQEDGGLLQRNCTMSDVLQ